MHYALSIDKDMKRLSSIICMLAVSVALLTSCLDTDDPYSAGFIFRKPAQAVNTVYANNIVDSIIVFSYGNWTAGLSAGQSGWCTLDQNQGFAESISSIPVRFAQNTTDNYRTATYTFRDANHPNDSYASVLYWQYATRGDGSLGSAADVRAITGSDGSRFEFTYDEQHRPISLNVSKEGIGLYNITLRFNDGDSILTVTNGMNTMRGSYGIDYQPNLLVGETDTVGYYSQFYDGYYQASANYAFNVEHHSYGKPTKRYAIKLGGQSLLPDSLHNADSLRIGTDHVVESLKLVYSNADNRRQSVDVNQLIFGSEECDPYQLLSLFRYARNSKIISEATGKDDDERITVSTTLNADGSVSTLTVTRRGQQVVYTLDY